MDDNNDASGSTLVIEDRDADNKAATALGNNDRWQYTQKGKPIAELLIELDFSDHAVFRYRRSSRETVRRIVDN